MATLAVIATVLPHIADLGNKLAPVIVTFLGNRLANIHRMKKELEALESLFTALRTGLDELEHRKIYEAGAQVRQIKDWIGKLKDVAYDLEDMLDECHVMASDSLGDHEEDCHPSQDTDHNEYDHPQPVVRLRKRDKIKLYAGALFGNLADRLKGLSTRVTQIMEEKRIFEPHMPSGRSDHGSSRSPTSSHMNLGEIVGRWNEREKIVKWLTMPDNIEGEKAIKVGLLTKIPTMVIVGTPGVGKTAVAKLIYNDDKVLSHFDEHMWVSVWNDFDEVRLTKALIEESGSEGRLNELNALQSLLIQRLGGKRFLIVLDDVWGDVTNEKWENFLQPLRHGFTSASRILVTTTNETIASRMGIGHIQRLDPLPDGGSIDLFHKTARTFSMSESLIRDLQELDIQMVEKCEQLPVSIKAMANAVRDASNKAQWETLLNRKTMWDVLVIHNRTFLSSLLRRFYELDAPLRRCFLSCCLYPKGKHVRIPVEELKRFWIAAGFIPAKRRREMELLAQEYVEELVKSSFFQYHSDSAKSACWVHDLVYELAKFIGAEEYSTSINSSKARYVISSLQDAISAASSTGVMILGQNLITLKLRCSGDEGDLPIQLFSNMKRLRGLVMNGVNLAKIGSCFSNLRRLRHLDLSNSRGDFLPNSIKNLERLRLLDLSNTHITQVTNQIDHLRYLETLILIGCDRLTHLPKSICNMVQLRNLRVDGTNQLNSFPKGIGKLTNLESLDVFKFDSEECRIMELKNLNHLLGKLAIECNGSFEIARSDNIAQHLISDKVHLKSLDLQFGADLEVDLEQVTSYLEELIKPNEGLEELVVKNFNGRRLATWMMSTTMTKLVSLTLISCHHVSELPSFGQLPCLRNLCIDGMSGVICIGKEFYTCSSNNRREYTVAFPMLETLQVLNLPNLEEWVDVDKAMPKLEVLVVEGAMKLEYIPRCILRGLKSIEIGSCSVLEHRYYTQMHELDDIPRININGFIINN